MTFVVLHAWTGARLGELQASGWYAARAQARREFGDLAVVRWHR